MEATLPNDPDSPVTLVIPRPTSQGRLTNFPLLGGIVRVILLIPHFVILAALGFIAGIIAFIAPFAILFTGNYPRGLFDFTVGYMRWNNTVTAYLFHLRDEYPPFTMSAGQHPVQFDVAYPAQLNRILNFPIIGMYLKSLLAIPHLLVLALIYLVVFITTLIAEFSILFTGSYPDGLHKLAAGAQRWSQRVNAYVTFMTDRYPPFSLS